MGKKTRVVTCATEDAPCDLSEKPEVYETCDSGSCPVKSTPLNVVSAKLQSPQWLFTEWSDLVSLYHLQTQEKNRSNKNDHIINLFLFIIIIY